MNGYVEIDIEVVPDLIRQSELATLKTVFEAARSINQIEPTNESEVQTRADVAELAEKLKAIFRQRIAAGAFVDEEGPVTLESLDALVGGDEWRR